MILHEMFPRGHFSPPATESAISAAEATLNILFPEQLRVLYLECDGFREDKGNAKYLLSLTENDYIGSLIKINRLWWSEWNYYSSLRLDSFLFFGMSSGDEFWGLSLSDPSKIIAYHHHMEDEYEIVGGDILSLYKTDY